MSCHEYKKIKNLNEPLKKVLLFGNPNVGKSVIFNRLTGLDVITANYTGTTVSYHEGLIRHQGEQALLIDVPGIYSLQHTSKAETVALDMLKLGADLIVYVLDATHLERNLHLALELQRFGIPIVYVLNMSDVAKRSGIDIDATLLAHHLRSPVIETVAVKQIGIDLLKNTIFDDHEILQAPIKDDFIQQSQIISDNVTKEIIGNPSFLDRLSQWCIRPLTGIPIMLLVLGLALGIVVGGGEALRELILLPLFNNFYTPFITGIIETLFVSDLLRGILVGEFGVLIKIIEWPFALILPYVLLFSVVFSFLEDSGYLPRLGILLDGLLKRIGLPGNTIIPFIMGYGCAVPAILGTRTLGSSKERIIVVSLIAIAVPCTAQTGAFIILLGDRSIFALMFVYMISFMTIALTGYLLNRLLKGTSRPLILEIPNLLWPDMRTLSRKIWIKLKQFVLEAQVPMFIGILIAALIAETGALQVIGTFLEPIVVGWLDLPKEASLSLLLGVVRRELAVMPLLDMNLTTVQLITGSVVALFYLPCISVFFIIIKEFGLKLAGIIVVSTFFFAFFFGGIIQLLLNFLM